MPRVGLKATTVLVGAALCLGTPVWAQTAGGATSSAQGNGLDDTGPHHRRQMFTLWGLVPYASGFGIGVGGRYTLPIIHDGFVPNINNSVELELGADLGFLGLGGVGFTELVIPAEVRWTFHLTPQFDLYPKFGLGYRALVSGIGGSVGSGFYWDFGGGLLYRIAQSTLLRAELGYAGLRLGVGFEF